MLNLILNLIIIWLIIDVLIMATAWYAATVIKPRYPNWWKQVVADVDPNEIEWDKRQTLQKIEPVLSTLSIDNG